MIYLWGIYIAYSLSKMITRRLSHFDEPDIWGVLVIIIFFIVLLISAYLFRWHNRTYATLNPEEDEEENEDL